MPLPPRTSTPIRQTLSDEIYNRLLAAIINGELEPGEILNDRKLNEWLGGSRTPLREALRRLVNLGLVEMIPNKYTRVTPIDEMQIIQAADTIYALYEYIAVLSTPRLTEQDILELTTIFETIRDAGQKEDRRGITDATFAYFGKLAHCSGNKMLPESIGMLAPQLARALAPRPSSSAPSAIAERMHNVHDAVVAADSEAAGHAVYALTEPNRRAFRKIKANS